MADYKSILKGTLNSVTKKAKDYVESGGLKEAYDKGSTTARCYANIASALTIARSCDMRISLEPIYRLSVRRPSTQALPRPYHRTYSQVNCPSYFLALRRRSMYSMISPAKFHKLSYKNVGWT